LHSDGGCGGVDANDDGGLAGFQPGEPAFHCSGHGGFLSNDGARRGWWRVASEMGWDVVSDG
jgi:hypothetical protein